MSEIQIGAVTPAASPTSGAGATPAAKGAGFGETLRDALGQVNQLQQSADTASTEFALGHNRDVAATLIAVEKANMAFQLTLQIRNKLVEAYQEVMRMAM